MSRRVYVAFGDSITDGYGVPRGFVSFLAEQISIVRPDLDLLTINSGMSGDTSRDGLYRLGRDVIEHRPDFATINFGVNDAFSGISPVQFSDNLRDMAVRIREAGCHKLLMLSCEAIPESWAEKQVLPYWEAMKAVAEEMGCVYADVHGRWAGELKNGRPESDLIISGDLHPNEEGHRLIADAVFEEMQVSEFLEGL